MNEKLKQYIESVGFKDAESFVRWQFTRYMLEKIARLEAEIQVFKKKYQMDYETFENSLREEGVEKISQESEGELDFDSIEWESLEAGLKHAKSLLAEMEKTGQTVYHEKDILKAPDLESLNVHESKTNEDGKYTIGF